MERLDFFQPAFRNEIFPVVVVIGERHCVEVFREGYIELRKYTEVGRPHVTNTLYLVNATENAMIDCNDAGLPYFPRLVADVEDRTETAAGQGHTFPVMDLAIRAQMKAEGR